MFQQCQQNEEKFHHSVQDGDYDVIMLMIYFYLHMNVSSRTAWNSCWVRQPNGSYRMLSLWETCYLILSRAHSEIKVDSFKSTVPRERKTLPLQNTDVNTRSLLAFCS